jgi:hypothetical protein
LDRGGPHIVVVISAVRQQYLELRRRRGNSSPLSRRAPVEHALAFGAVGLLMSVLGLQAMIAGDLAPAWYA